MLTEKFIASIRKPAIPPKSSSTGTKDAGIFQHELQPVAAPRAVFKKSTTSAHCLAVSETHIFAAQSDKAVIHVYSRERGNHENTVPFPEKITCVELICDDTVLALGTAAGSLLLWETLTGRMVSVPECHLQAVSVLAVDPSSNFLLSGSVDSNIHVWSIPLLLSFSQSAQSERDTPLHTLSNHQSAITALKIGHTRTESCIAISASEDKTAVIWDFRTGDALRTYLLPSVPKAIELDVVDRGFYTSYDDGSIQLVDFYTADTTSSITSLEPAKAEKTLRNPINPLHTSSIESTSTVLSPSLSSLWKPPDPSPGPALSLLLSWDSTKLLSGHDSGAILIWDISTRSSTPLTTLPGPVTNLHLLPIHGIPGPSPPHAGTGTLLKPHTIVKPRPDLTGAVNEDPARLARNGGIPLNYEFRAQILREPATLQTATASTATADFRTLLACTVFPSDLLADGIAELAEWSADGLTHVATQGATNGIAPAEEFVALGEEKPKELDLQAQNELLRKQVRSLQRVQRVNLKMMSAMRYDSE
ncbi:WD40 repeat-like protein, partial [Eremomyces bilateralis CBS 781.70]